MSTRTHAIDIQPYPPGHHSGLDQKKAKPKNARVTSPIQDTIGATQYTVVLDRAEIERIEGWCLYGDKPTTHFGYYTRGDLFSEQNLIEFAAYLREKGYTKITVEDACGPGGLSEEDRANAPLAYARARIRAKQDALNTLAGWGIRVTNPRLLLPAPQTQTMEESGLACC